MACGDPDEPECTGVLRDVWLFLDNELDPQRRAAVQHHLDDCSPCLAEAGLDEKLKALLRSKCGGEHAPEHLRSWVAGMLSISVSATADGEYVRRTSITTIQGHSGDAARGEPNHGDGR